MKRILAALSVVSVAVLVFSASVLAQGRYTNRYSRQQVNNIIVKLEESSNRFTTDFDRELDRSPYNGTRDEDQFNAYVRDYESAMDRLRRNYDQNDSWWASRQDVQDVLSRAQPVNTMMNTISFRRNLERQWNAMRNDLNTLADTFDLPGLNGGGYNGPPLNPGNPQYPGGYPDGYPGGYQGQMTRPPTWAQGTFYSTDGSNIILTISPNGQVTVVNNGMNYYGGYYRNTITVNNDTSDLTQTRNGIRTYNRSTRQYTQYSRSGYGNTGGGGGWNPGDRFSTPPSWAQGTFYATNGSGITMTIRSDGRIVLYNSGQTYYGSYYQDTMTLNGDVSTITRTRNGIRTYNQSSGQTTDYRRQ